MQKYRKRPVVIDAEQFHGEGDPATWPDGVYATAESPTGYALDTLEGTHAVRVGDFVITGVVGEKYPCREDIFRRTYEPAHESGQSDDPDAALIAGNHLAMALTGRWGVGVPPFTASDAEGFSFFSPDRYWYDVWIAWKLLRRAARPLEEGA